MLQARAGLARHPHETMSPLFAALLPAEGKACEATAKLLLEARADVREADPVTGQSALYHCVVRNPALVPFLFMCCLAGLMSWSMGTIMASR